MCKGIQGGDRLLLAEGLILEILRRLVARGSEADACVVGLLVAGGYIKESLNQASMLEVPTAPSGKRHQGFQSTIPGLTSQIPPDWRKAHATALREYCAEPCRQQHPEKTMCVDFLHQDKKRLQHALISDSDGRSLQGMLDGFEANGIKYYNKYATLKELMGRCWSAATTGSFIFWASGLRRLLGCEGYMPPR